jgi:hypothetical protein
VRKALARKLRATFGSAAKAAKGALGISSETCVEDGRERRTARSMPPAEMFRAVANSRNSLSCPTWPLTKTGIANGKRDHLRRSVAGELGLTHTPSVVVERGGSSILGAKAGVRGSTTQGTGRKARDKRGKRGESEARNRAKHPASHDFRGEEVFALLQLVRDAGSDSEVQGFATLG